MDVPGLPRGSGTLKFSKVFRDIISQIEKTWGGMYYNYKIVEPDDVDTTVQELIEMGIPRKCIDVL